MSEGGGKSGEDESVDSFLREVARADAHEPPENLVGQKVAHFLIEAKLGEGGMGVVYRARDEKLRRTVALKVLPSEADADDARRARFLREARAAAAVTHANIATVYDVGEADGRIYIAMEYVAGDSLRQRISSGPLLIADALAIGKAIARALVVAHEMAIVHRDLKPDNVMVAEDLTVKVLDFGLAKILDTTVSVAALEKLETAPQMTGAGRILGTPGYMSPEQTTGRDVDVRTDIFALGVVLYEMVTGARPFRGSSSMDVLIATNRDAPEPPSKLRESLAPDVERVILRCLEKDREERFASARALLAELESLDAEPLATQSLGANVRMAVSAQRGRQWAVPAVALGVAVVAVFLAVPRFAKRPDVSPPLPSASAAPGPTGIMALPVPRSGNAAGLAAYKAGVQDMHDADWGRAAVNFRRAVELEPGMAAAHMRLVVVLDGLAPNAAAVIHEEHARAFSLRADLDERDRTLLDIVEPFAQDIAAWNQALPRVKRALEKYPLDAELWGLAGFYAINVGEEADGLVSARKAVELDPSYADAWQSVARGILRTGGDSTEALKAFDQCLAVAPSAGDCLLDRSGLHGERGECPAMETDAKRGDFIDLRAAALFATGAPREAIEAVLASASAKTQFVSPEVTRALLDFVTGEFVSAEAHLRQRLAAIAADANDIVHAHPMLLLAQLLLETGRGAAADGVARDYLVRRETWLGGNLGALTPIFRGIRRLQGGISEKEWSAGNDEWLREPNNIRKGDRWANVYGHAVETEAAASAALEALAKLGPIRRTDFLPSNTYQMLAGHILLLAGKVDEAIPLLEKTTKSCFALAIPFENTRAHLWLGQAREAKHDTAGACASYGVVLDRWGNARPRSVTAEKARERVKALSCPSNR